MYLAIILAVLILDQLTKMLAMDKLSWNQSYPIISGVFHLTLVKNQGAAFGILKGQIFLFIITSLVTVIYLYLVLTDKKKPQVPIMKIALSLVLGGALGNLVDRMLYGHVIDFLDFRIWPVFNFADTAITCGVVLILWNFFVSRKKKSF